MTGLLISVRCAAEARTALDAGARLIDVKEPDRGPLGAPTPRAVAGVTAALAGQAPVSVALGELVAWEPEEWAPFPTGVSYAKFGLSGCARYPGWAGRWKDALERLPAGVGPVAVVYADWRPAAAPEPDQVLAAAVSNGCRAALVDTFDKSRGGLLDWLELEEIGRLVAEIRRLDMLAVLGGSLTFETIPQVLPLAPDFVAVRGAACGGHRTGAVDAGCVRRLAELLCPSRTP